MTEKMFEQAQEQSSKWLESISAVSLNNLKFMREELERQVKQGMGQVEYMQQSMHRHLEQATQVARTVTELQEGLLQQTWQAMSHWTPPRV